MVDLPKVEQSFTADVSDYVAKMQVMIDETKRFVDEVDAAILKIGEFKAALDSLPDMKVVTIVTKYVTEGKPEDIAAATETLTEHVNVVEDVNDNLGSMAEQIDALKESIAGADEETNLLASSIQDSLNEGFLAAAKAASTLDSGLKDIKSGASDAATAWETLGAVSFTAVARMNSIGGVIHWIIAGGSELAATLIPAMVALGAAASVQLEGWGDLYTRMTAVNEVGQSIGGAFGKTVGQILGMGDALQKAQTAADPQVFELLGAAINGVNSSSGQFITMGTSLTGIMDQFAAKIDVDLKNGMTEFTGLIGKGVEDLVEFGQVFGNIGHALLNFASAMPGLAEVLLKVIDGISGLILWLSKLPAWIITTLMVFEELFRWGGLLVGIFAQIGSAIAGMGFLGLPIIGKIVLQFGEMFKMIALGAIGFVGNLGQMIAMLGKFTAESLGLETMGGAIKDAGVAMEGFDTEATTALTGASTGLIGLGVAAVAGLAVLVIWLNNSKTATQQWVDSLESSVNAAKGLQQIGQTYTSLASVTNALSSAQAKLGTMTNGVNAGWDEASRIGNSYSTAIAGAGQKVNTLSQAQQQLSTDFGTEIGNVDLLSSKYKIGYVEAAELAGDAGANLTQTMKGNTTAAQINLQMVENYVQGLGGMGAVQGALGTDINAVTIEEDLQASKTQQLTQAMSGMMSMIQGPSNGFLAIAQSLQQYGSDAQAAGAKMTGLGGVTVKSTKDVSNASIQLQQDFNNTVSQMQTYTNSLTTAAAITGNGGPMIQALKDEVAVLLPMAGTNANAAAQIKVLWQEAGGSASDSLKQIGTAVSGIKNPMQSLQTITGQVSLSLSNLGQDASNLANTISTSLNQTLVSQAEQLTGVSAKSEIYLQALQQYGPNSAQAQAALNNMNSATARATELASEAAAGVTALSGKVQGLGTAASQTQADRTAVNNDIASMEKNAPNAATDISKLSTAIQDSGSKSSATSSARAQLIKDLEGMNVNAQTATKEVDALVLAIAKLQNKTVTITTNLVTQGTGTGIGVGIPTGVAAPKATGGRIPGYGGGDIVPALLEPGETVVPKHLTNAVAPLMAAHGVPGFAAGGMVAPMLPPAPDLTGLAQLLQQLSADTSWADWNAAQPAGKITGPQTAGQNAAEGFQMAAWASKQLSGLQAMQAGGSTASLASLLLPGTPLSTLAAGIPGIGIGIGALTPSTSSVAAGDSSGVLHSHINVNLDGQQIWTAVQKQTLRNNIRNNGIATGLMKPK